ncbi:MAG: hypothetical protein WDZ70_02760 [Candidatus Paceibacterota bacterium]
MIVYKAHLFSDTFHLIQSSFYNDFSGTASEMTFKNEEFDTLHPKRNVDSCISLSSRNGVHSALFLVDGNLRHAHSDDLKKWEIAHTYTDIHEPGLIIPDYTFENKEVLLYGKDAVHVAFIKDGKIAYNPPAPLLSPRDHLFDKEGLRPIHVWRDKEEGVLFLLYETVSDDEYMIGGALLDVHAPHRITWRSEDPLIREKITNRVWSIGACTDPSSVYVYVTSEKGGLRVIQFPYPFREHSTGSHPTLTRYENNPIITPDSLNDWESEATFNPAAFEDEGKVHILYRALGPHGLSSVGYAVSDDGYSVDHRHPEPIYYPREPFEGINCTPGTYSDIYASGGGWGGCEDPKITVLEDTVYMTYVAYNGWAPPRAAITSLSLENFRAKKFNWKKPQLISPPGVVTKSASILPEKIGDTYYIFHRIFPHILIDKRDTLDFSDGKWLKTHHLIKTRPSHWDSRKISVGATPIKTNKGWLVIYHAVDDRDRHYRYCIGALLLDLEHPEKVIARSSRPALMPTEWYENEGKPGVAYPCGAVIKDGELLVYYGGGDKVVCVAHADADTFIQHLLDDTLSSFSFEPVKIR